MTLPIFWFVLIGVLWGGYFLLEGFDFGVGILLPFVGRHAEERGAMLSTIAPVWDGNEVWLVVAAGATFAAFPAWYATMFSGFYLALLLVLVLLMVRVVSFEWRERGERAGWRSAWIWANALTSAGAPFVWGVVLAALLGGVPLDANGHPSGGVLDMLSAYTVLGGLTAVALFALHGATFLVLRTTGDLHGRATSAAHRLSLPVVVGVAAFLAWTVAMAVDRNQRSALPVAIPAVAGGLAVVCAALLTRRGRTGPAFTATAIATLAWVATVFTGLYPRVLVSHPGFQNSLTVSGAASAHYALTVITVVAAILTPIVLLYQAWTYRVLRARLSGQPATAAGVPRAHVRAP